MSDGKTQPVERGPTYARPTSHRVARRLPPPHSKARFEAETLGGRLWHAECQTAAKGDSASVQTEIPLEFSSTNEYICTFDPLVLEEAREGLKGDWAESCAAGRVWRAEVVSLDPNSEGWFHAALKMMAPLHEVREGCPPNAAVVLTFGRPPPRGAAEWLTKLLDPCPPKEKQGEREKEADCEGTRPPKKSRLEELAQGGNGSGHASREGTPAVSISAPPVQSGESAVPPAARVVAGIVQRSKDTHVLTIRIHPQCAVHAGRDGAACACVLSAMRSHPRDWWLAPARMLISAVSSFSGSGLS